MGKLVKRNNKIYAVILAMLIITLLAGSMTGCGTSSYLQLQEKAADQAAPEYSGSNGEDIGQSFPGEERKVIQNAAMVLAVGDVNQIMDKIVKITQDNEGYTVNSKLSRGDDWVRGEINIKVPSAGLGSVMEEIAALGEIKDKSISTLDVSEEYYDSQARLSVWKKKEERLLALIDQAKTIEEIISVENELTRVRSDIEVLQGRVNYLENATSYSSIDITLNQAATARVEVPEGVLAKALQAFINSSNGVARFLMDFFILLIAFIPWAILLAVIVLIFRALKRKYQWSFKKNKEHGTVSAPPEEEAQKRE